MENKTELTFEFAGEEYTPKSYAEMLITTAQKAIKNGHYSKNPSPKVIATHEAIQLHNWLADNMPPAQRFAIEVIKEITLYTI